MKLVELIGGRFDGLHADVPDGCVTAGIVVVPECSRHGANRFCGCDDEMWYGYFQEPEKGAGRFIVLEEVEHHGPRDDSP